MRLLALSQTGLEYVRDPFDRERYVETGELGAELIELVTTAPIEASTASNREFGSASRTSE